MLRELSGEKRALFMQLATIMEMSDQKAWEYVAKQLLPKHDMGHMLPAMLNACGYTRRYVEWVRRNIGMSNRPLRWEAVALALFSVYGDMLDQAHCSEVKSEDEKHYYDYVPYDRERFYDMLHEWSDHVDMGGEYRTKRFIDVGCGIGDKVFLAWLVKGWEAHGVELNDHTYQLGKYALHNYIRDQHINLIHHDAFDLSYEDYDIVYMYCPIKSSTLLGELYQHVYETMREGAIMVEVGNSSSLVGDYLPSAKTCDVRNISTTVVRR